MLVNSIFAHHEELIWRTETGYIRECGTVPNLQDLQTFNYDVIYTRKRNWLYATIKPNACSIVETISVEDHQKLSNDAIRNDRAYRGRKRRRRRRRRRSLTRQKRSITCGIDGPNFRPCYTQISKYHCNKRTGQWSLTNPILHRCSLPVSDTCQENYLFKNGQFVENPCQINKFYWPLVNGNCYDVNQDSNFLATDDFLQIEMGKNSEDHKISGIPCGLTLRNIIENYDYSSLDNKNRIEFSINSARNLNLDGNFFENLPAIKTVDLEYNGIKLLPENLLQNAFTTLNCSDSNTELLDEYGNSKVLYQLKLSHNFLSYNSIPGNTFDCVVNSELNLAYNWIEKINPDWFGSGKYNILNKINLAYNNLEEIKTGDFPDYSCDSVDTLDLKNNRISRIDPTAFHSMPGLVTVFLQSNRLVSISDQVFQINPNNLPYLNVLDHIDLSKNRLEFVIQGTFENNDMLGSVDLSDNRCYVRDCESISGGYSDYTTVPVDYGIAQSCWCENK